LSKGDAMKQNYDFSKGERGKFFRSEAVFKEPVYLDDRDKPIRPAPHQQAFVISKFTIQAKHSQVESCSGDFTSAE
jgi:hypothetical protein